MKRTPDFKTEAEMCDVFISWLARYPDWIAYAETEGWDILLAHHDGTQIGIQAKLKFNMAVLAQTVESGRGWNDVGPDYRAVLVPAVGGMDICDALGLTMIRPRKHWNGGFEFDPDFGDRRHERWHFSNPTKRYKLPAYIPDVRAGVPSPSILSKWKIAALQVSAVIELRGYVTRQDFRVAGVDHRRWVQEWLDPVPGKTGAWCWRPDAKRFSAAHPVVYSQVLSDVRDRGLAEERTSL